MASYEKRNNKWTVRFRIEQDGKQCNKRLSGFNTKKEAEKAYSRELLIKKDIATDLTINELFELYKVYKKTRIKESIYITLCQVLKDYICPTFGKKKVVSITAKDIINWQTEIDKLPLKFSSKDRMYVSFVNLIGFAVEFYNVPLNIVSKVGNFKNHEQKQEMSFWTNTEFEQFIAVVDNLLYKALFATLYLTGARKGEAMALLWKDIDLQNNVVDINKTFTNKVIGGGYKLTSTKTVGSIRQIIIPNSLNKLLAELKDHYAQFEGFTEQCFVFGMSRPLPLIDIDRKKKHYCKLAGVKEIRIHDFRHSHASLLLNQEQNIMLVAQRLGHTDINMTLNTYSHLFPNKQRELMNSLDIKLEK